MRVEVDESGVLEGGEGEGEVDESGEGEGDESGG